MNLIKVLTAAPKAQPLLPNVVVRARVVRINLDQSVVVEVGKGGLNAVIPKAQRTPTSLRAGQLRCKDTLWLSVHQVVYLETGVQYEMSMRSANIPLEILKRLNHGLHSKVELQVLKRIPGVETVIEVRPCDVVPGADYHVLVAGPHNQHVRSVSELLQGEAVILRINRNAVRPVGGAASV